jgi:Domain of unknown function (DUF5753)/Helix-turn-helix domain
MTAPQRAGSLCAPLRLCAVGWSATKISRAESGRDSIPPEEVAKLLDFYRVTEPLRSHLLALAEDATRPGWWEDYVGILPPEYISFIGLEAEAASERVCQFDVIPGLLQIADYGRQISLGYQSVIPAPSSAVETRVRVRAIRQERLVSAPVIQLSAVIDEAVLLRNIGGPGVMRPQLEHLIVMSELPNVDIRVLPLGRDISLAPGSFEILSFAPPEAPGTAILEDVVGAENLTTQLFIGGQDAGTYMFRAVYDALVRASLSPDDSKRLIIEMVSR